jgi:hypothetical protein
VAQAGQVVENTLPIRTGRDRYNRDDPQRLPGKDKEFS